MKSYPILVKAVEALRGEPGLNSLAACVEQITWVLLLKFLDELHCSKSDSFEYDGSPIFIKPEYQWRNWAHEIDNKAWLNQNDRYTAEIRKGEILEFINKGLFPYMQSLVWMHPKGTLLSNVGLVFYHLANGISSSRTLAVLLRTIDQIECDYVGEYGEMFDRLTDELSRSIIGFVQPPVALVNALVDVMGPVAGQTIYDPAAGTGRFIVKAADYIRRAEQAKSRSLKEKVTSYFVDERNTAALVFASANAVLNEVECVYLHQKYALGDEESFEDNITQFDLIFSNLPFGGKVDSSSASMFHVMTDSEELLFLQYCMKSLRSGGKAAVIVPEGVLSQRFGPALSVKKELLESFNLHTILSLPANTFSSTAVKSSVLFFDKNGPTKEIWMYECRPEETLSKYRRLRYEHLADFVHGFKSRRDSEKAKLVPVSILKMSLDLNVRNYLSRPTVQHDDLASIVTQLRRDFDESMKSIQSISTLVESNNFHDLPLKVYRAPLRELCVSMKHGCPGKALDSGNVKFIRITDIHDGAINWVGAQHINLSNEYLESYRLNPGDIVFARVGATAGKSSLIREVPMQAVFASNLIKLVADTRKIVPDYLFLYLQSREFLDQVDKNLSGAVQLNISSAKLGSIEVPVPAISEQRQIVALFGEVYNEAARLVKLAKQKQVALQGLKMSLLGNLFNEKWH